MPLRQLSGQKSKVALHTGAKPNSGTKWPSGAPSQSYVDRATQLAKSTGKKR